MIASKKYIVQKLIELQTTPKRKFSQNFLIDEKTVATIVEALDPSIHRVIEIGPGLGSLTEGILKAGYQVTAYEIDPSVFEHLRTVFSLYPGFSLQEEDILKVDTSSIQEKTQCISNLPYHITTEVLEKILLSPSPFTRFVFMVQKEVRERLEAKIKTKAYGPLRIFMSVVGKLSLVCKVNRDAFYPSPNVDSLVFCFDIKQARDSKKEQAFYAFLKQVFSMRRKTLLNSIQSYFPSKEDAQAFLLEAGFSLTVRPEEISEQAFLTLFERLAF